MATQKLGWFASSQQARFAQATLEQNGIPSTLVNMPRENGAQACLLVVEENYIRTARKTLKSHKMLKNSFQPAAVFVAAMSTKVLFPVVIFLSLVIVYLLFGHKF